MKSARVLGAVLAFTAAAVAGCEGLIGADFDVERVTCNHRRPNPRPPPGNYGDGPTMVVAVRKVFLGVDDDSFLQTGLDLDDRCTNRSEPPSCKTPSWPLDAAKLPFADGTDGEDGIDNGIGRLIKAQQRVFRSTFFSDATLNARTESGENPPFFVLRITGYNPASTDDGDVKVELFLPAAGRSGPWPPADPKTVDLDERTAFTNEKGEIQGRIVDERAYMSGGQLVAHFKPTNGVRPAVRLGAVAFSFEDLTLMGKFPEQYKTIEDVRLAGKVTVREMFQQLGPYTNPGGKGAGICTDNPSYPRVKGYFCGFADLRVDDLRDPEAPCDALSVGLRFQLAEASLGKVLPADVVEACPPEYDPTNDDCSTMDGGTPAPPRPIGGPDAGTEAGVDAGPVVNCVPPGTPNNERGLGGACTTSDDCPESLCSAEFGAPPGYFFCTTTCFTEGESCGTGVRCAKSPQNPQLLGCVPERCLPDAGP